MICPNCKQQTSRLIIDSHGKACANCRGMSESGGARLDGILTRGSDRIRRQQQTHEGDIITPHVYDPTTKQHVPNPDFVDRYPDKLPTYFTETELNKFGYSKAGKIYKEREARSKKIEQEKAAVEYAADPDNAKLKEVIKGVQNNSNSAAIPASTGGRKGD